MSLGFDYWQLKVESCLSDCGWVFSAFQSSFENAVGNWFVRFGGPCRCSEAGAHDTGWLLSDPVRSGGKNVWPIPTSFSLLEEEARDEVVLLVGPSCPIWVQFPLWQILRTLLERVLAYRAGSEVRPRPPEVLSSVNYFGTKGLYAFCELHITCVEIRHVLVT